MADRLFAAEATWHQGAPLAQTVFTCLYLLEPQRYVCASTADQGSLQGVSSGLEGA